MISLDEAFELAASYELDIMGSGELYNPRETDEFWIFACGKPGTLKVGGRQVVVSKEDGMVSPLILPSEAGFKLLKQATPVREDGHQDG